MSLAITIIGIKLQFILLFTFEPLKVPISFINIEATITENISNNPNKTLNNKNISLLTLLKEHKTIFESLLHKLIVNIISMEGPFK
jgi:hypothetical protein